MGGGVAEVDIFWDYDRLVTLITVASRLACIWLKSENDQTRATLSTPTDDAREVKMEKVYQVFVSSTYSDLKDERQQVSETLAKAGYIPSGMELFPAADQ
jgi:hypothetical protein